MVRGAISVLLFPDFLLPQNNRDKMLFISRLKGLKTSNLHVLIIDGFPLLKISFQNVSGRIQNL